VRSIVIGTAGHIDHGKSALVRALTGTDPDPSSRARLDRGIDRTREEQARGITIDIGFAHLTRAGGSYSFVDVPGHERFVRNMLAGAGGIDLVLLVVAADESVMPQTREHFEICRLLRIPAGVIALTKTDLADAETIELATLETRELVRGSFLAEAPIVPVSARTGRGLEALLDAIDAAAGAAPERAVDGPARLPIDRVFSVRGFGTVATGTLVSGAMAQDRTLVVLPGDRAVKVRGLQVHGRAEERVSAGQRVAVNLGGVDAHELARGHVLCDPEVYEAVRRLDAAIELLPAVAGPATADAAKPTLKHGMRIRLHCGTSEVLGRVAVAAHDAAPGLGPVHARIRLESPIVVTRGDRFILRSYSPVDTIGGGVVLDPMPPRGAIRTDAGRARFRRLDFDPSRSDADAGAGASDAAAIVFLDERARAGMSRAEMTRRAGLSPAAAERTAARLVSRGLAAAVGERIVSAGVIDALRGELLEALKADVRALKPASGSGAGAARVDVAAFKGRYGVTRKYAIPLLEYLDRERVTRRVGEARIVL
jgi:selenocysteine-specific elongation factor